MEWISIEDRLPSEGQIVAALVDWSEFPIITEFRQQHEAPLSFSSATIPVGLWFDEDCVTHWVPLPDLPNTGTAG